jgi:hypothetical protein
MADNVAITAGSGTTIAADDIGAGLLVQRVKATWGPDGTANDTDVASGKPMPVQLRASGGTEIATSTTPARVSGVVIQATVTLSADTSAFANGDIIADTQQIDAALRTDGTGTIRAIQVFDADDVTAYSFTLYFHQTSTSMGSENSGITISDANAAAGITGCANFGAGDVQDLINGKMYYRSGLDIPVKAVSGTDDIYISMVIITGTPTHTAGGIIVKLWIQQD